MTVKFFLFCFLCNVIVIQVFCQANIEIINFTYSSGVREKYGLVNIKIEKVNEEIKLIGYFAHSTSLFVAETEARARALANAKTKEDSLKIKPVLPDETFSQQISPDQFEKLVQSIQRIQATDIEKNKNYNGFDGSDCKIIFGDKNSVIRYSIWATDSNTKERNLQDYLETCKLLLQTVKLNPKKFFHN